MLNKIYVHSPKSHETLTKLFDANRVNAISAIAAPNKDGSQVCVIFPLDRKLRLDLPQMIPGIHIYPSHLDSTPIGKEHAAKLKEHGVNETHSMREAALILYDKYLVADGHPET